MVPARLRGNSVSENLRGKNQPKSMCNWDSQHVRFSTLDRSFFVMSPVLIKLSYLHEDASYIL